MANRMAGACYVKVDGEQLYVEGSIEFPLTDVTRETLVSTSGVVGYKETPSIPYVAVSVYIDESFPFATLKNATDMTITAECANGMVYTLQGAALVGDIALNPIDGTTSLRFEGVKGILS